MQNQEAATYFLSKQLLPFGQAELTRKTDTLYIYVNDYDDKDVT